TIRVLARRNREIQPLARLKHLATERGEALLNAMFRSPGSTLESRLRNVGKLSARNIERRHACCTSLIFQCPAPPAKLFGTSRTGSRFSVRHWPCSRFRLPWPTLRFTFHVRSI